MCGTKISHNLKTNQPRVTDNITEVERKKATRNHPAKVNSSKVE